MQSNHISKCESIPPPKVAVIYNVIDMDLFNVTQDNVVLKHQL